MVELFIIYVLFILFFVSLAAGFVVGESGEDTIFTSIMAGLMPFGFIIGYLIGRL